MTKDERFNYQVPLEVLWTDDTNGVYGVVRDDGSRIELTDDEDALVFNVPEARALREWLSKVLP